MKHIATLSGTLAINDINHLLKLHTAKNIQAAVQQEVTWFSKSYNKPQTVSKHPSPSLIEDFQKMLYFNRYDKICEENGMTAMELAMVCVNRWISSDHITWIMKALTEAQKDTYCIFLNGSLNTDSKTFRRFKNGNTDLPSKLLFALNVGRNERGTFLGSDAHRGCHWALCHVDIVAKKIVYGDSLAWPFPNGLLCRVEKYLKVVCKDEEISDFSIVMLHDPQNKCPMSGTHRCGSTCADFYPLQTCSNICGVVVMVVSAIACHNFEFFQHISTRHSNANTFPSIFLQAPSRFAKYLRFVIASWLACNLVNLEYIVPRSWQRQEDHLSSSYHMIHDETSHDCRASENKKSCCNTSTPITDNCNDHWEQNNKSNKASIEVNGTSAAAAVFIGDSDDDIIILPAKSKKDINPVVAPIKKSLPTRKFTLKRHIRTKHTNQQSTTGNCCCHDCSFIFMLSVCL